MKTAVITTADDNFLEGLETDFFPTLRGEAEFSGPAYLIYYGENMARVSKSCEKYGVELLKKDRKLMVVNQRSEDIFDLITELPSDITHLFIIDADVWFQAPVEPIFQAAKDSYGYVEEDFFCDEGFNYACINSINNEDIKKSFLKAVKGRKLAGYGMVVGRRDVVRDIVCAVDRIIKEIGHDFFGFDQAVFNYVIRKDGKGVSLPQRYDFSLITNPNKFYIKDGLFYESDGQLINVVHNSGSSARFFKKGRQDIRQIPTFDKSLPGTLWALTSFFNPAGYKNKAENYRRFRAESKGQGLKLICVELAFNGKPFELGKNDADILVQVRSNSVMWQKERLLNIGLAHLPADCDKVAWIDCDLIFKDDNWIAQTEKLLEKYIAVQLFSFIFYPRANSQKFDYGSKEKLCFGAAYAFAMFGQAAFNEWLKGGPGLPAGAWACRREILEKCGFFDSCIFGSNDNIMMYAIYGVDKLPLLRVISKKLALQRDDWHKRTAPLFLGSVSYLDGYLEHLWHGNLDDRSYVLREKVGLDNDFDPATDIRLNGDNCFEWASAKVNMHRDVLEYFLKRKEE